MVFRRYLRWGILLSMAFWPMLAPETSLSLDGEKGDLRYHIRADTLSYDDATKTYQARGQVTVARGDDFLKADHVDFNDETKVAKAWGNVRLSSGNDWLTGSRIDVNLDANTGTVYDGTLFVEEGHFYIRGDEIQKTGKACYYIRDARFTTCDGDCPDWQTPSSSGLRCCPARRACLLC